MNKMKKRVTSVICTIALMASSIGTYGFVPEKVSAEETDVEILYQGTSGDLDWSIDETGCLKITGNGDYEDTPWIEYADYITTAVVEVEGITNTVAMLCCCDNMVSVDLSNSDLSNVTESVLMFYACLKLKDIDFGDWNLSNVTNAMLMFAVCESLESLDLTGWDVSSMEYMSGMFTGCVSMTSIDISGWDATNTIDISQMFWGCTNLSEIKMEDTYFNINVDDEDVFFNCFSLDDSVSIPKKAKVLYQGTEGTLNWSIDENGCLSIDGSGNCSSNPEWENYAEYITTAVVEVTDISYASDMFSGLYNVKNIDLSKSDFSDVTSTSHMFEGCTSLETIDFGDWNMSSVTDTWNMFYECSSLKDFDVSNWDMSNVRSMDYMFAYCTSLTDMDMSDWNVNSLETAAAVFQGCTNLVKLDLSNWDAQYVIAIGYMFADCTNLEELILEGWEVPLYVDDTDILRNCDSLSKDFVYPKFDGASGVSGDLTWTIDAEGLLTISGNGDYELDNLEFDNRFDLYLDIPEWTMYWGSIMSAKVEVTNITSAEKMFSYCPLLESVEFVKFDTSKVTSMDNMFDCCRSLTKLDMSGWNLSNLTSANNMLYMCDSLKEINSPINANVTIKLLDGTWYDENRNVCTEIPQNMEHSVRLVEKSKLTKLAEDFKLEINSFQIRNDATGIRTIYSVNDPDNQVVKVGLVYGLSDYSDASDMVVNSSDKMVHNVDATEIGKMNNTVSEYADATTYVMTMMFGEVDSSFYEAPTMVRTYALLEDGTYIYSDVVEYSVYDVCYQLYKNSMATNEHTHANYRALLKKVNSSIEEVAYNPKNTSEI